MRKTGIFAICFSLALSAGAMAQTPYATGEISTPNWSPGTGAPIGGGVADDLLLKDDGVGADATASDGIWTVQVSAAASSLTVNQKYDWKVAGPGFSNPNTPNGPNAHIVYQSGDVIYYWDTTVYNDGFVPDTGAGATLGGIIYNNQTRLFVDNAASVQVTGSFQTELGATDDWTPGDPTAVALTDAGNGPVGDGIYQGSVTGLPAGQYQFKVTLNGAFGDTQFGSVGLGGDNLSFNVLDPSNTITFTLDANKSRVRADNPAAAPGPPFYAQSDAWGTAFSSLEDLGAAVGNVYQKVFTVATPDAYTVKVVQGEGRAFPESGDGYYFETTSPNQEVLVVFDRNTYTDTLQPASDFVVVLDNATRNALVSWGKVQPVGSWQGNFGATDWNPDVSGMDATDAGGGIFRVALTELNGNSDASAFVKAVGRLSGQEGDNSTPWRFQFGGPNNGLTDTGDNDTGTFAYTSNQQIHFVIDAVTGRVGAAATAIDPVQRGGYFSLTSVDEWTLY